MSKSVKKSPVKKSRTSTKNATIVKGERMVATNLKTRLEEPLFVTHVCEHDLQYRKTPMYRLAGIGLKTNTSGLSRIVSKEKAMDAAKAIGEKIIKCETTHRPKKVKKVKKEPKEKKEKKEPKEKKPKKKVMKSPVTSSRKESPTRRVMRVSDSPPKKKKVVKKAVKKAPKK